MHDVVLTCFLNNTRDPARGKKWKADVKLVDALRRSVVSRGHPLVVLHDCLTRHNAALTTFCRVVPGGNPYFHRWQVIADWLDDHDDIDRVWCVDATDVVMLNDPFPQMQRDVLYSGSEPRRLGGSDEHNAWLRDNHPNYAAFCDAHTEQLFMNPGILGGDAELVGQVSRMLANSICGDMTDMGAWQQIAHRFTDQLVTGYPVHTEYRAQIKVDPHAWWAHK